MTHTQESEAAPVLRFAPDGAIWVCGACGKTTKDRFGGERGWDESCMLHSILADERSLIRCCRGRVQQYRTFEPETQSSTSPPVPNDAAGERAPSAKLPSAAGGATNSDVSAHLLTNGQAMPGELVRVLSVGSQLQAQELDANAVRTRRDGGERPAPNSPPLALCGAA